MEIADNTNKYINEKEPWKLDQDQAIVVSTTAINIFKNLCVLLHPVIPNITLKMLRMLNDLCYYQFRAYLAKLSRHGDIRI